MIKDKFCKRWREYFQILTGSDDERDTAIETVGLEARREEQMWGRVTHDKDCSKKSYNVLKQWKS